MEVMALQSKYGRLSREDQRLREEVDAIKLARRLRDQIGAKERSIARLKSELAELTAPEAARSPLSNTEDGE